MNKSYAEYTQYLPHRPILEKALNHLGDLPKIAIDCGCGAGNESSFLLNSDFFVYAFDSSTEAQNICINRFKSNDHFSFSNTSFENYNFPRSSFIIALLSLFFCSPSSLNRVLNNMKDSLYPNGILVLQFLGKDDAWVIYNPEKFLGFDKKQLENIFLDNFDILFIDELKGEKPLASGHFKFWHIHTLILKKRI